MSETYYPQGDGRIAVKSSDGQFLGSIGTASPSVSAVSVAMPTTVEQDSDEVSRLLDAGLVPVDTVMPAGLAATIEFEDDHVHGAYVLDGEVTVGTLGDIRREHILSGTHSETRFPDDSGLRYERIEGSIVEMTTINHRGPAIEQVDDPEGVEQALDILSREQEMGYEAALAHRTLRDFTDKGVASEDDMVDTVIYLVGIYEEANDGVDVGMWAQTPRAIPDAFSGLVRSLPVSTIRRIAFEEYGRSVEETDDMLSDPDQNPLLP